MKMSRILAISLAVIMIVMIPLAAVAEPISFWHTYCGSDTKSQVMSDYIAKFREENPDVEHFVGDYYYSYFIGNTNAKLYFKLSLKAVGSFQLVPFLYH